MFVLLLRLFPTPICIVIQTSPVAPSSLPFSRACPTFAESRFNRTTSFASLSLSVQAKFPSVICLNRVLIHIGSFPCKSGNIWKKIYTRDLNQIQLALIIVLKSQLTVFLL